MKYIVDLKYRGIELFLFVLGIIALTVAVRLNTQNVLMYLNSYGNYICFFVGALSGIIVILLLSKYFFFFLRQKGIVYRIVMWVGFNSLVLFPVHLMINQYFNGLYEIFGNSAPIRFLFIILFGIPVCNLISNYYPWMLGMSKKNNKTLKI